MTTKQRGRKSSASLSILPIESRTIPIQPPASIENTAEGRLFIEIVASLPADHFRKCDIPLLQQFCRATLIAEKAADVQQFTQMARLLAVLASKLRICPSARKRIAEAPQVQTPKPWLGGADAAPDDTPPAS
jgi:hypothetical protein